MAAAASGRSLVHYAECSTRGSGGGGGGSVGGVLVRGGNVGGGGRRMARGMERIKLKNRVFLEGLRLSSSSSSSSSAVARPSTLRDSMLAVRSSSTTTVAERFEFCCTNSVSLNPFLAEFRSHGHSASFPPMRTANLQFLLEFLPLMELHVP